MHWIKTNKSRAPLASLSDQNCVGESQVVLDVGLCRVLCVVYMSNRERDVKGEYTHYHKVKGRDESIGIRRIL